MASDDLSPASAALHAAGRAACLQGNLTEAEALLRSALEHAADRAPVYVDLGVVLAAQDRHHDAAACYLRALADRPSFPQAHLNLANSLRSLGNLAEALNHYDQALSLDPELTTARVHGAVTLRDLGDGAAAKAAIRQAVAAAPGSAEAWHYYGEIYQAGGEYETAIAAYQRELALVPAAPRTLNLLASALQCAERLDEAIDCYYQALKLDPGHVPTLNNLGTALQEAGRPAEAIDQLRQLLTLAPDHADGHWNLALSLLKCGDYPSGWEELEWRWRKNVPVAVRPSPAPLWDGSALAGKSILLQAEQGFGDTFQFIRYATLVAELGGEVIVDCQSASLKPVIATVAGVVAAIDRDEPLPPCDRRIPLLSLPRLFGTTMESIPAAVPYLQADPCRVEQWRRLIGEDGQLRVGLVWSGRQELQRNRKRSCTLSDLAPLAAIPGVTFYSLQVGAGQEQAATPPAGMRLMDLAGQLYDFGDTAALIAQLDLVITIDTSVAHLAGGMGKPVWLMLPLSADWRWLMGRDDSPWYPTMRLFRQSEAGDWHGVAAQVGAALREAVAGASDGRAESFTRAGEQCFETDPQAAAGLFRQALARRPATPQLYNNLAVALQSAGELTGAELAYRAAVRLRPAYDLAWYNMGFLLDEAGRFTEAEECYRQGLAANPAHAGLHFNLAHLLLRFGDFESGLREYEWRWSAPDFSDPPPCLPSPRWDGTPLAGQIILLTLEQGLGDAIHFIRYARHLSDQGGRVIVAAPRPLQTLLATAAGVSAVVPADQPAPPHDCHTPLLSLPFLCGTTASTIPGQVPYLAAPPERQSLWQGLAGQERSFRIGLVWHGGQYPVGNRKRSLPLALFAPLADIPGISFFSLQVGPGQEQASTPPAGMTLSDLTDRIHDFSDTAALIETLDLVISIDTAVAHLAGAMGKPVWTLLPAVADWRWFLDRDDSPWYPTMRLFRQEQSGDWPGVMARVREALLFELARGCHARRDWEGTAGYCRLLLADQPGHPAGILHLGDALHQLGRYEEALTAYDQAKEWSVELENNRGNTLLALGRFDEAIAAYRRVLRARPSFAEAHVTIGTALQALGRPREALAEYRAALAMTPDLAEAHWNLALILLLLGEYRQGWQEYEWRWQKRGFTSPRRDFPMALWDGSPLAGRTILLHGEQGFGDTIQFARYAPLVAARGGRVVIECHAALVRLMQSLAGVAEVCAFGEPLPECHCHAPLMSLPGIFGTTLETIPAAVPYLAPPAELADSWQDRVGAAAGLRIGLAWAGRAYPDPNRSCPLAAFAPLATLPGVRFISLQVDANPAQRAGQPADLILEDLTGSIADFADTAALMANLDLVVTIDSAVAHLAGALGKPTWLLLPLAPDWRWGLKRGDSPWYPTMRLFRQATPGGWDQVLSAVAAALAELLAGKGVSKNRLEEGLQCHEAGDLAAARKIYDAILEEHPHHAEAAYLRGTLALQQNEPAVAEEFLRRAIAEEAEIAAYHNHLGLALQRQERLNEAELTFAQAAALPGDNGEAWLNLGVLLRGRNRLADARHCLLRALHQLPQYARAWQNLGVVEQALGNLAAAHDAYRQALTLAPDYATARWNLALLYLLQGDFERGWQDFSARFSKSDPVESRHQELPGWDGTAPLAGRRLLIHAEQGFGDTFQFVRYLPLLAELGATVFFETQGVELSALVGRMPGVAAVFARGEQPPACDLQVPLLSLPQLLKTTVATIPGQVPYLRADPGKVAAWQEYFRPVAGMKVGLVWWGRNKPDPNRSLPLATLAPLAGIPGIRLFSLQVGAGSEQLETAPPGLMVTDLAPRLADFHETAAAITALDLVISIDSAVAHLAGALGKPTWLLLPFAPDWRWFLQREDSPWYPTMRLFRQEQPGDWPAVVGRIVKALASSGD